MFRILSKNLWIPFNSQFWTSYSIFQYFMIFSIRKYTMLMFHATINPVFSKMMLKLSVSPSDWLLAGPAGSALVYICLCAIIINIYLFIWWSIVLKCYYYWINIFSLLTPVILYIYVVCLVCLVSQYNYNTSKGCLCHVLGFLVQS